MKQIWTIARREFQGYFDQPTAYLLVVAFLSLVLFLTFRTLYATSLATLRPLFDLLPWLFAVFVPAVTMRSLAEERRSGTMQWLLAQPVTEAEVVLGKFLGNWMFVLVALMGTFPTALGVLAASEADAGIVVAQYLGGGLLAAQTVAIGLWASAAARNQITAFILGAGVIFLLMLMGTSVVQIGLPPVLAAAAGQLSLFGHFRSVGRGVVDFRDVLYFVSTTGIFVAFALALVSRDRLSHGRSAYRRLRTGTVALALAVVVLNLLGSNIRGRLDLTRGGLYTLADGSRAILGDLDDRVTLKLVISNELPLEIQPSVRDVRDLVADLRRASDGRLVVDELNPAEDEEALEEASSLGFFPIEFNVLRDDEFQVKRGWFGLALIYADQQDVIPVIDRTEDLEFRLVSSISAMTSGTTPRVGFVTGFGAKGPNDFQPLREGLQDRYDLRAYDLEADSTAVLDPDSIRVLVVAGPSQTLDSTVVEKIDRYLDDGGAALMLLERSTISPQMPTAIPLITGLEAMLEDRGVRLDAGLVYDLQSSERINAGQRGMFQVVRPYPLWPILFKGGEHPIVRDLNNITAGWASPVTITDDSRAFPLWTTTDAGGVQPAGGSLMPEMFDTTPVGELGIRIVAAVIDPDAGSDDGSETSSGAGGRVVVVGDASFLENQFIGANAQNLLFAANAVDWLAKDEALIRIRSKNRRPPPLMLESDMERNVLKWGSLIGVPFLFVLIGLYRVGGRKRRAEDRWPEVGA